MKLYYCPGTCSLAPHIALIEAGLKFDSTSVDLKAKKTKNGDDYLKINPKGYVPALQLDDGKLLTEVAAILQWIADKAPEKKLLPQWGDPERYTAIENINFIATEIHKGFGQLFNPALPDEGKKVVMDRLKLRLAYLEKEMGTKKFVMGSQFSLADAYLYTVLGWAPIVKLDLKGFPNLASYHDGLSSRPSIQEAKKQEA